MIESRSNARIKKIQKLRKSARYRRQEALFVAEGWKMTEEALRRSLVKTIYISTTVENEFRQRFPMQKFSEAEVEILSESLFREISDTVSPQGIMALVNMPCYDREDVVGGERAAVLCLEDIRDPGNLGTMFRTAEGAGMSGVLLSGGCADIFNPKVVRSTMGSLFRVPFYVAKDLTTEVERMKNSGFTVFAAHLQGDCSYEEADYSGRTGILIGNEAGGLSEKLSALADVKVKIPMEGELESLNAAVSAALLMYEVHRNRR